MLMSEGVSSASATFLVLVQNMAGEIRQEYGYFSVEQSLYRVWPAMKTQNYPTVTWSESSPDSKCM